MGGGGGWWVVVWAGLGWLGWPFDLQLGLPPPWKLPCHCLPTPPNTPRPVPPQVGSAGLEVDPALIVWTPYSAEKDYEKYRN